MEWAPGNSPAPWGQCLFLSLQGLCQGRTHRLERPVPSRNEMVSGPDKLTNSICPGSHQEQIPAPSSGLPPPPPTPHSPPLSLLWWICFSCCQGHPSEMMGGLPLGRAADVSGKQALAGFLVTLALTGYRMTMGLNRVSPKPGAHHSGAGCIVQGRYANSSPCSAAKGLRVLG